MDERPATSTAAAQIGGLRRPRRRARYPHHSRHTGGKAAAAVAAAVAAVAATAVTAATAAPAAAASFKRRPACGGSQRTLPTARYERDVGGERRRAS